MDAAQLALYLERLPKQPAARARRAAEAQPGARAAHSPATLQLAALSPQTKLAARWSAAEQLQEARTRQQQALPAAALRA